MIIVCPGCRQSYNFPKDRLPQGKRIRFKCKKCNQNIDLDLRNKNVTNNSFEAPQVTHEELPSQIENDAEKERLKKDILKSIHNLPPMPQVVIKTQELLADPSSDVKQIAEVIETDQAITAKLLKLANSVFYGMSGKIASVSHAAVVLGHNTIGEIVMLAGAHKILDGKLPGYGYDSQELWQHSLAVAFGSKFIATMRYPELANQAHTAGLIHDVGRIILDSYIFKKKEAIDAYMQKEEKTFLDAENYFFGFNHADIAYEVCRKWQYPQSISQAIKRHHDPSTGAGQHDALAYLIHMADYMAILSGIGYDDDDILYKVDPKAPEYLNLNQEDISNIVLKLTEAVNNISG